jgi:DNA-binding IclR family transcriptional regulator
MATNDAAEQLRTLLQVWEEHYQTKSSSLTQADLYRLWIRLFRLSRRLGADYQAILRGQHFTPRHRSSTGETIQLFDETTDTKHQHDDA